MIVAIEGLPCSGKSSILAILEKHYNQNYLVIPEFIVATGPEITTTICKVNDIAKTQLALLRETDTPIIMDRSYLSTLAYTYAEGDEKYMQTETWYHDATVQGLIVEPDVIVFLDISVALAIERAKKINRFNEDFAWFRAPERALALYQKLLEDPARSAKTLRIDTAQMTIEAAADFIYNHLQIKE